MKRNENLYPQSNKRPKLQQDIDDIWGDDPEIDEIDRCINLATQLCSQDTPEQHLNNSLLTYDDFKGKPNMRVSTQLFLPPPMASVGSVSKQANHLNNNTSSKSTSTLFTKVASDDELSNYMKKIRSLEMERKKLEEMYETKNGEITILRSQLKQAHKAVDNEKMDKLKIIEEQQQKWNSKFNTLNKELEGHKCELKLKNLETANLREKLFELKKVYSSNLNMSILNEELRCTQITPKNKLTMIDTKKTTDSKITQTESNKQYYVPRSFINCPLSNLIPKTIFEICLKSHFKHFCRKNKVPLKLKEKLTKFDEEHMCINHLHPDLLKLIQCTEAKLNSEDVTNFIQKVVHITKNHLSLVMKLLNIVNSRIVNDDENETINISLEESDIYNNDCIFSATPWNDIENGVEVRRYIAILSAVSLYNDFLFNYLTDSKNLCNSHDNRMKGDQQSKFEFLKILLDIVTVIRKLRESYQYCGLLSAILKLLSNLTYRNNLSPECFEIIFQIFKQIIFSHPVKPVLRSVCEFLKYAMRYPLFAGKMCTGNSDTSPTSSKDTLLNFSQDACTFRILAKELEFCDLSDEMACNIIEFLKNGVSCDINWMFQQEDQRCECLVAVYSLGINILYNTVKKYSKDAHILDKTKVQLFLTILRNGRIFLHILTMRVPDLVMRCSRLFSQYYKTVNFLNTKIPEDTCLEKIHETAVVNLMSQFNFEAQKECKKDNDIDNIFNSNFTSL